MGKPEERGETEKEVRKLLGPTGPEIMELLRDELESCLPDHEDWDSILAGLVGGVITEELTRQAITKQLDLPRFHGRLVVGVDDV